MPLVHRAPQAIRAAGGAIVREVSRGIRHARQTAALGVVVALALGACGGSSPDRASTRPTAADLTTVRTANCMLWNVVDTGERRRLVGALRRFFGQRLDTGAHVRLMPDARALRVIDSYCRLPFARAFLIYRLYGNATAFTGSGLRMPRGARARPGSS